MSMQHVGFVAENKLLIVLAGLVVLLLIGRLFGNRDIPEDSSSVPPSGDDDDDDDGGGDVA